MISSATIAAATASPAKPDFPALRRALDAFVLYPAGEGLSGFDSPDAMLSALTDGVCRYLVGDYEPLPEPILVACLDYAAVHYGTLLGHTYRGAAEMAVSNWHGFRERFLAGFKAAA